MHTVLIVGGSVVFAVVLLTIWGLRFREDA